MVLERSKEPVPPSPVALPDEKAIRKGTEGRCQRPSLF